MRVDVILAGGGLANCLVAMRLAAARPGLRLAIVERGDRLGGNHTWSFHDSDLSEAQRDFVAPLVRATWPSHEVRFPEFVRRLPGAYNSIDSRKLDSHLQALSRSEPHEGGVLAIVTGDVERLEAHGVTLTSGERLEAPLVLDGRGPSPAADVDFQLAYQKFLGLEVELEDEHGLEAPILMDATVEQRDGYRFIYTLPLSSRTLLIEDTRYSDGSDLPREEMRRAIALYAERHAWRIAETAREEEGVLPIALGGDIEGYWSRSTDQIPLVGLRAMLFHPTTGYSLPDAVALADRIASESRLDSESIYRATRDQSIATWRSRSFFRLLNRMMFLAAAPEDRIRILRRFYRLGFPLTRRFYAARLRAIDKLRLLVGRPPVPIHRALVCVPESSARRRRAPSRGPRR